MIHQRQVSSLFSAIGGDPTQTLGQLLTSIQPTYQFDDLSQSLGNRRGPRFQINMTMGAQGVGVFTAIEVAFPTGAWLRRVFLSANGTFASQATGVSQVTTPTNFSVGAILALPEVLPPTSPLNPATVGTIGIGVPITSPGFAAIISRLVTGSVPAAPANGIFVPANVEQVLRGGDPPIWLAPGQTAFAMTNTANAAVGVILDFELPHIFGVTA